MNIKRHQYSFLIWAKRGAVAVLCVGAFYSFTNFMHVLKANQVSNLNDLSFMELSSNINLDEEHILVLESYAKRALKITPPELDKIRQATLRILKDDPSCLNCYNRIVFIDIIQNDALSTTGIDALSRSFKLSPYGDTELMKWRLSLSSKYWNELDEPLQKSAISQITALAQGRVERQWLRDFETDIIKIRQRIELLQAK